MGVYRTLVYKMHYKWPVYRWRYTGRIPYTMKKFQNIRGRIYLQRYTRIPLKICFSLSFVSSTTCSSTAARAGEGTPGTHCTQQWVHPPFCDSPFVYALTRIWGKYCSAYFLLKSCMHSQGLERTYCSAYFLLKTTIHITNSGLLQQTDIQQHFSDQSNYPSPVKVYHLSPVASGW